LQMETRAAPSRVLWKHGAHNPIGLRPMWANNRTVNLSLFKDLSIKMALVDLVRWMLKQVQHDDTVVTA